MKIGTRIVIRTVILPLLILFFNYARAQPGPKPNLFDAYPASMDCPVTELEKAFSSVKGDPVEFIFSGNSFTGVVVASKHTFTNLRNVVIRITNLQGTIFHISKITNADNTNSYTGRILNLKYGDGFELKNISGNYYLKKIKTDDVIQD
ncbi:MAG: hypothetical protein ABJA57_06695 [Ginsengibacter sp.]